MESSRNKKQKEISKRKKAQVEKYFQSLGKTQRKGQRTSTPFANKDTKMDEEPANLPPQADLMQKFLETSVPAKKSTKILDSLPEGPDYLNEQLSTKGRRGKTRRKKKDKEPKTKKPRRTRKKRAKSSAVNKKAAKEKSVAASKTPGPKKRRGRKKTPLVSVLPDEVKDEMEEKTRRTAKGRSKSPALTPGGGEGEAVSLHEPPAKKRRGRKKKSKSPAPAGEDVTSPPKKKRGRKKKAPATPVQKAEKKGEESPGSKKTFKRSAYKTRARKPTARKTVAFGQKGAKKTAPKKRKRATKKKTAKNKIPEEDGAMEVEQEEEKSARSGNNNPTSPPEKEKVEKPRRKKFTRKKPKKGKISATDTPKFNSPKVTPGLPRKSKEKTEKEDETPSGKKTHKKSPKPTRKSKRRKSDDLESRQSSKSKTKKEEPRRSSKSSRSIKDSLRSSNRRRTSTKNSKPNQTNHEASKSSKSAPKWQKPKPVALNTPNAPQIRNRTSERQLLDASFMSPPTCSDVTASNKNDFGSDLDAQNSILSPGPRQRGAGDASARTILSIDDSNNTQQSPRGRHFDNRHYLECCSNGVVNPREGNSIDFKSRGNTRGGRDLLNKSAIYSREQIEDMRSLRRSKVSSVYEVKEEKKTNSDTGRSRLNSNMSFESVSLQKRDWKADWATPKQDKCIKKLKVSFNAVKKGLKFLLGGKQAGKFAACSFVQQRTLDLQRDLVELNLKTANERGLK